MATRSSERALIYVNGHRKAIGGDIATSTLLNYLRQNESLTGTKLGCGEGGCGACTVMISHFDKKQNRIVHRSANACLVLVASCDGMAVTTIEAVRHRDRRLSRVQSALVGTHGSQCGFCTPGIVMSMFALLRDYQANPSLPKLSTADIEGSLDGNLCRCTGYRPILDAFDGLLNETGDQAGPTSSCSLGDQCCRVNGVVSSAVPHGNPDTGHCVAEDRDIIFPPELIHYHPVELNIGQGKWLRPVSFVRFACMRVTHPEAQLIVGNTELGIETKFKHLEVQSYICVTHVAELSEIVASTDCLKIGASVTWTELCAFIDSTLATKKKGAEGDIYKFNSLRAIRSQIRRFAGRQIRNVAAVGGNVVTASPISDINPVLMAAGARFVIYNCEAHSERIVHSRDFFISYRKVDLHPSEVLTHILVPWNASALEFTHSFKVSRRKEDDIAIVSAGIRICLSPSSFPHSESHHPSHQYNISDVALCFGGLAAKTIYLEEVENDMRGAPFNQQSLDRALERMVHSTNLKPDVPGGMPAFRQSLALGFLFKAFVSTATSIDESIPTRPSASTHSALSSLGLAPRFDHLFRTDQLPCRQNSQIVSDREPQHEADQTGKSVPHISSTLQVTGEAKFLDDTPPLHGELQAALVLSTEPHASILGVDYSQAKAVSGVHRIIDIKDVEGENLLGLGLDEPCFAGSEVTTVGQVIAIVLAESADQAKNAARAVHVQYARRPAVLSIEEAIEMGQYASNVPVRNICRGNAEEVLEVYQNTKKVVEGVLRIGAQEHWYLEPHGTIAVPTESDEMLILSSTQAPGKTQDQVARVLGISSHKVVCKVKRIGGGFGGKETRSIFISAAAAVAARATSRPVRLILDRDTDMMITGTRHPFLAKYKAAFESSGRIRALKLEIFHNIGNSLDLSIPVLDRSLYHAQNCYDIENVSFFGRACYTNTPSATAFRGFGGPQGMLIAEQVIEHVAWAVKLPAHQVRDLNIFGKQGNKPETPFGMKFNPTPLLNCWDSCLEDAQLTERMAAIRDFNENHSFRKRGIAAIPTMFGISFTFKALNQAGALVHVYHSDGSVLISHGGVEMGQGLHTKICQVAATELEVPMGKIFVSETATDKVPNSSPTAASASSDMYGMAVQLACKKINENLAPVRSRMNSKASWEEVVHEAWLSRIALSATGFYATPELDQVDLGRPNAHGRPFFYYTNGAAVSEVEVDPLTGEFCVLRTDIVMDVGRALNPAIDVGQIEGAFVQGLGWCTMEEVVRGTATQHAWVRPGHTFTAGPSTYKIPSSGDIPRDFRVRVLNSWNEKDSIHSSKAIGEPPLFLAASVFFAIRDAIRVAREKQGLDDFFELDSPATVERIRLCCEDLILKRMSSGEPIARPSLSL